MANLVRMDLYRMFKARSFKVCLILAALSGFCGMPLIKLFTLLLGMLPNSGQVLKLVPQSVKLSTILKDLFPMMNLILIMFSACYFFYADIEHGYIKNIAGQMPKKSYTVLSKFLALTVHNLIFIAAGVVGNLLGNVIIVKIIFDGGILKIMGAAGIRFALLQGVCSILLFVTAALRSKTFGMVLSAVFGSGMMSLIYFSIDAGLGMALKKTISIENYMPDQLLAETDPKLLVSLPAAAVTIAVFLFLAIHVFDKRDVK